MISTRVLLKADRKRAEIAGSRLEAGRYRSISLVALSFLAISVSFAVVPAIAQGLFVSTLAGSIGGPGARDGDKASAQFSSPSGLAIDSSGNVYVADRENHSIRKIDTGGQVTTIAGLGGVWGANDGMGSGARFHAPEALAVDPTSGDVFVADTGNHAIRRITPAGLVSTFSGVLGLRGLVDGPAQSARFSGPAGIAIDSTGRIYVADTGNSRIRTLAPDGSATSGLWVPCSVPVWLQCTKDDFGSASLCRPRGLAIDPTGDLWVADTGEGLIRRVRLDGSVTTWAGCASGGQQDGTGSGARFHPGAVAVDGFGDVWVVDTGNQTLRKIDPLQVVTTVAGKASTPGAADGVGGAARFDDPRAMVMTSSGNFLVADANNHCIRRVTPAGAVTTWAGRLSGPGSADGAGTAARFNDPHGVACDSAGNLFVADTDNHTIRKVTPAGDVTTFAGLAGDPGFEDGNGNGARFNGPMGVAITSDDSVFVADSRNGTIRKITPSASVSLFAGSPSSLCLYPPDGSGTSACFVLPVGIVRDSIDNLLVTDENSSIRKVSPLAVVTTLAGAWFLLPTCRVVVDGTGSAAGFCRPEGPVIDSFGNLFVSDSLRNVIRRVTPSGVVTTPFGAVVASYSGYPGYLDAPGKSARFHTPAGMARDLNGDLILADSYNHVIRKLSPSSGSVTTIAGMPGVAGNRDGSAEFALFDVPSGVAVDASGIIYVTDSENNSVRKIEPGIADRAIIDAAFGSVGQVRQLDTSPQTATSWQWTMLRHPAASTAALSSSTIRNPTFTPDVPDLYEFQLEATGGAGRSLSTVTLKTCQPLASPVGNTLKVTKSGSYFLIRWTDVPPDTSYSVRDDSWGAGRFEYQLGTAASGSVGVSVGAAPFYWGNQDLVFIRVWGFNPCGESLD